MRLQLIRQVVAILVVSANAPEARAQATDAGEGQATTRVLVYSDDDATSVVTSAVDARVALPADVQLGAHALVDVVSTASVDVISAATTRWDETRVEVGGRALWSVADTDLSLGYTHSVENDWLSHRIAAGVQKELFSRNTVVSAAYALTANTVGRASDPNFERSLDSHSAELGIGQLIDDKTRVGAAYTLQVLSGFTSSPYRYVIATDGIRVPERHPDSRVRHAASAWAIRALGPSVSLRGRYRFYADDWGIRSHTATVRLSLQPFERLLLGLEGRGYLQNGADFYRAVYTTSLRYMSFDRELSSFWDAGGFADAAVTFGPVVADAKLGVIHYRFDDFPALPRRNALIAGGGARVTW